MEHTAAVRPLLLEHSSILFYFIFFFAQLKDVILLGHAADQTEFNIGLQSQGRFCQVLYFCMQTFFFSLHNYSQACGKADVTEQSYQFMKSIMGIEVNI